MPIYEYRCSKCLERFEVLVRGEMDTIRCSNCGSSNVSKMMSVFGFSSGAGQPVSAGGSSCGGCHGHNCGGCKH